MIPPGEMPCYDFTFDFTTQGGGERFDDMLGKLREMRALVQELHALGVPVYMTLTVDGYAKGRIRFVAGGLSPAQVRAISDRAPAAPPDHDGPLPP